MSERRVATDALENLGYILDPYQKRDAIHLAVEPVQAGEPLRAGQWIGMRDGRAYADPGGIAIVDPFIKVRIEPGDWFYLVLAPRLVQSLRHVWSHPDFPDKEIGASDPNVVNLGSDSFETQSRLADAEEVLRGIADEIEVDFFELISRARDWLEDQSYWRGGAEFEGLSINIERFWSAYDTYTNTTTPGSLRESFFSCSC